MNVESADEEDESEAAGGEDEDHLEVADCDLKIDSQVRE